MAGQFGYRIPAPSGGGAPIAMEYMGGGGNGTNVPPGGTYVNTVVTVGTMDKWMIVTSVIRSVSSSVARLSLCEYESTAQNHVMTLFGEATLIPASGNALCIQHFGVRVNDGINFGTFRRTVDPAGAESNNHYYSRLRFQGSALNIGYVSLGSSTVDTGNSLSIGPYNSNGSTEQVVINYIRDSFLTAPTFSGTSNAHYNTTLDAISYTGEQSQRGAVTGGTLGVDWTGTARYALAMAGKFVSL